MSGWVIATLLVLFFALATLVVLAVWLWQQVEAEAKRKPRERAPQAPNIVIRRRRIEAREILDAPTPRPPLPPPPVRPTVTPAQSATPRPAPQPTPSPAAARVVMQPAVTPSPNGNIGKTTIRVDFDAICKRTGQPVRTCQCPQSRELRANGGH
jgi:hypothetical protein